MLNYEKQTEKLRGEMKKELEKIKRFNGKCMSEEEAVALWKTHPKRNIHWGGTKWWSELDDMEWTGERWRGFKIYEYTGGERLWRINKAGKKVYTREDVPQSGIDTSRWIGARKRWVDGRDYSWSLKRISCGSEQCIITRDVFDWMEDKRMEWEELDGDDLEERVPLHMEEWIKGVSRDNWWQVTAEEGKMHRGLAENLSWRIWWAENWDFTWKDFEWSLKMKVATRRMREQELKSGISVRSHESIIEVE